MQKPERGRLPAIVPQAYRIPRPQRAPAQIPLYAPEIYREEPARDDKEEDAYVIDLN